MFLYFSTRLCTSFWKIAPPPEKVSYLQNVLAFYFLMHNTTICFVINCCEVNEFLFFFVVVVSYCMSLSRDRGNSSWYFSVARLKSKYCMLMTDVLLDLIIMLCYIIYILNYMRFYITYTIRPYTVCYMVYWPYIIDLLHSTVIIIIITYKDMWTHSLPSISRYITFSYECVYLLWK